MYRGNVYEKCQYFLTIDPSPVHIFLIPTTLCVTFDITTLQQPLTFPCHLTSLFLVASNHKRTTVTSIKYANVYVVPEGLQKHTTKSISGRELNFYIYQFHMCNMHTHCVLSFSSSLKFLNHSSTNNWSILVGKVTPLGQYAPSYVLI